MKISSFLPLAAFGLKTILFKKSDPILGTIIVTDRCNLHCKHCSVNNITSVLYPYTQIRREMEQLYSMGIRILFFCGGETFLWRDGDITPPGPGDRGKAHGLSHRQRGHQRNLSPGSPGGRSDPSEPGRGPGSSQRRPGRHL